MGITEALMAYMTDEDDMADMLKYLTEWELAVAEQLCSHLHPDAILHHDDWGSEQNSFLRPEMFEDYFVDHYREIYKYYHEHGVELVVHHSDSYCANLIDYMIDMGIDIWQGCMRSNNVPELVNKYKGQITFMGNIDNKQVDFDGWTQEDCTKAALRAIKEVDCMTGFIPCITQGGPGSLYAGTYQGLWDAIDKYNCETFGFKQEEIEANRLPINIMF